MENETYRIEKLDHFGRGIIKLNNKIIFIENAIIDDLVKIKIVKEKKKYSEGKIVKIVKKSPLRREFCKYSNFCGGCNICNLLYESQLKYKEEKIGEVVNKFLKKQIKINDIISTKDINYRNKITLHVKDRRLGLYEKNSNAIVEIDKCMLVDEYINEIIDRLRNFIKTVDHNISKIVIKKTTMNEVMLVFYGKILENEVIKCFDDIDSIFINDKNIKDKYITEKLGSYKFRISKDSFFQVNNSNTINLYNKVIDYVKINKFEKVLDLYCGTGTIGICVSKYVGEVIGIEIVPDAIECANINKKINDIRNIEFICGRVEDNIESFKDIDLVIVDPPRAGLDKKTIDNLVRIGSRNIIYISCDPVTLARDLNMLSEEYDVSELTPVDMFPNTYHVECVTVLSRKDK